MVTTVTTGYHDYRIFAIVLLSLPLHKTARRSPFHLRLWEIKNYEYWLAFRRAHIKLSQKIVHRLTLNMRAAGQMDQHHHLRTRPFLARCENKHALTEFGLPVTILNGDFPNTKQGQLLQSVDRPEHVKTFPTNCYLKHKILSHEL